MMGKTFADALVAWRNERTAEAEQICRALLAQDGRSVDAYRLLADILATTGRTQEALDACRRAADLQPTDALIWLTLGGLLASLSRQEEALGAFDHAISRNPSLARAHAGRAMTLISLGRDRQAVEAFATAVHFDPSGASPVFLQAGYQLMQLGRPDAALAAFDRLTQIHPHSLSARQARAITLVTLRRFDEAAPELAALLNADPTADYLAGVALHAKLQCCDWRDFDPQSAAITQRVRRDERADAPLSFIVHNDSPSDQLNCARTYAADKCVADAPARTPGPRGNRGRLRIAYLSGDFHDHAVGQSMVEVLEAHDRTKFEIFAFSTGGDDGSPLRSRIERGVEHFLKVAMLSDQVIATRMAALGIDIAVDLGGHSTGGRTRVLAFRPAALQVSFLGFPGTTGTDFIDYLIADERVIPETQRAHYSEHVVYLPDSYFPTPRRANFSPPSRAQAGLPPNSLVYCVFHGPHKISPRMFAAWMKVLNAVPDSVLWLRSASNVVRENLGQQAERFGVARGRLLFAERTATRDEHLARFALADLFLDTYPYGAHTTASEALQAQVPVITLKGPAFASRVAFSLLYACGLESLAVDSIERYESLAVELGLQPDKLAELRRELGSNSSRNALFAPQRFCRRLETVYLRMHARRLKREPPSVMRIGDAGAMVK